LDRLKLYKKAKLIIVQKLKKYTVGFASYWTYRKRSCFSIAGFGCYEK